MTLKQCITCENEKNTSEFRKDAHRKDGLQSSCKICTRKYHKAAYTIKYGIKALARCKIRHAKIKMLVDEYKRQHPCRCGEKEIVCLEFHHLDPNEKEFSISGNHQRQEAKIVAEMEKCIVVCANCHKKIHAGIINLES